MPKIIWIIFPFIMLSLLMDSLKKYKKSHDRNDLTNCLLIAGAGGLILFFFAPFPLIRYHRVIITIFCVLGIFAMLPKKGMSLLPFAVFLIAFSFLFIGSNEDFKSKLSAFKNQVHAIVEDSRKPETERQLEAIEEQKETLENRIEQEIPKFMKLLYSQAREIKEELQQNPSPSTKSYLMDELDEIARTMLVLDKEKREYNDLVSELSSIERTLIRLKESEKLFEPEYEEFMDESRKAIIKSRAKLGVRLDNELGRAKALEEIEVRKQVEELLR